MGRTIFEKIWDLHVIASEGDRYLIYIDRHYIHEVTSPVAFERLRISGRRVRRPDLTVAVMDHNVPTSDRTLPIMDKLSLEQMELLRRNAYEHGIMLLDYYSPYQGIVHVIGPELGLTLPGMTIACGDSHTATHGALGALAFGVGTSEVEHILATQTLWLKKPKTMEVRLVGRTEPGVMSKDVVLAMIGSIGAGGAIGHAIEYTGEYIGYINVEERMTLTNMAIEAGARTAIISPDDKTIDYLKNRPFAPKDSDWDEATKFWRSLATDPGARFDRVIEINVSSIEPQVTWGTTPAMVSSVNGTVPDPSEYEDKTVRASVERALKYMGLKPGMRIVDITIDRVFIGSCTNARLYDLIQAARVVKGKKVKSGVRAMVVPGSQLVKRNAERLGLHRIFIDAGFEWRNSGCSLCIGMNEDRLSPGERCASTSNRNFENRQGPGGRTHLVSPMMAAAAAIEGHFVDVREFEISPVEDVVDIDLLERLGYSWMLR
ncbi:isopropylmalate isomerase large subunit [Desulfurococcaceae archaeon AG1]|nr:isopropylmalate isomerase large subunit [Desulfurococcaceae archaeon AG1]